MSGVQEILSWTLIHSFWIGSAIWILTGLITTLTSQSSAKRIIKIGGLILFLLSIILVLFQQIPTQPEVYSFWSLGLEPTVFNLELNFVDKLKLAITHNSRWISWIWLLGALFGVLRYLVNKNRVNLYRSKAIPCTDLSVITRIDVLSKGLGIRRRIKLLVSPLVNSPMTTGVMKPIIYFPAGLISGFNSQELDTILLHELAHIRRNDYLVNTILVLLETTFFFNPFVILMVRNLRKEMEYTCDDEVLKLNNNLSYAKTLIKLQEINLSNQVALAAKNNSEFKNRIERMITQNNNSVSHKIGFAALLFLTIMVSSAFVNYSNNELKTHEIAPVQQARQDTLWLKDRKELEVLVKDKGVENLKGKVLMVDREPIKFIIGRQNALEKSDKMMAEIRSELIKDGILNEDKQKVTLMFQYSDLLNGKTTLGNKYEKYKAIFKRYFPVYDSFATTRVFRYNDDN